MEIKENENWPCSVVARNPKNVSQKKKVTQNIPEERERERERTQRKSIINKRKENKEQLVKDRTWKFVGAFDSKCL